VIVRRTIVVLTGNMQRVRGSVRRPRTALVGTVLSDHQSALEHMILRGEAQRESVAVAPRVRLDGAGRRARVQARAQDRSVADALIRGAGEGLHRRSGLRNPAGGATAALHTVARAEHVLAQRDVPCEGVSLPRKALLGGCIVIVVVSGRAAVAGLEDMALVVDAVRCSEGVAGGKTEPRGKDIDYIGCRDADVLATAGVVNG